MQPASLTACPPFARPRLRRVLRRVRGYPPELGAAHQRHGGRVRRGAPCGVHDAAAAAAAPPARPLRPAHVQPVHGASRVRCFASPLHRLPARTGRRAGPRRLCAAQVGDSTPPQRLTEPTPPRLRAGDAALERGAHGARRLPPAARAGAGRGRGGRGLAHDAPAAPAALRGPPVGPPPAEVGLEQGDRFGRLRVEGRVAGTEPQAGPRRRAPAVWCHCGCCEPQWASLLMPELQQKAAVWWWWLIDDVEEEATRSRSLLPRSA